MRKGVRWTYVTIIISILIIQQYTVNAIPVFREQQIKKVIKSYFDTRYEILSKLEWDKEIEEFFAQEDSEGLSEKDALRTMIEYKALQKPDLRFKKYDYKLDYEQIEIKDDIAIVELCESHNMNFNCSPQIQSEMNDMKHQLILVKTQDGWKIKKHSYHDEIKNKLEDYYLKYNSLDKAKEQLLQEALQKKGIYRDVDTLALNYKIKQEQEKMHTRKQETNGYTFYGYNLDKAVDYALKYALDMNPKYGNYEKWGGDCTNFVSQCLYAGQIPFDNVGIDVRYKWYWYSESSRTPSWTAANSLKFYLENNNKDEISIGIKAHRITLNDLLRGDIIQLIDDKSKAYHSIICTDYAVENGWVTDYLISQHSGYDEDHRRRLRNYPLSQIDAVGIFWSIDGYYNK